MKIYLILGGLALLLTLIVDVVDAISSKEYYGDWK